MVGGTGAACESGCARDESNCEDLVSLLEELLVCEESIRREMDGFLGVLDTGLRGRETKQNQVNTSTGTSLNYPYISMHQERFPHAQLKNLHDSN